MDRINGANTVDIGSGRRGFRNRNLGAGLSGTQVDAAFMNALQEEVVGLVEAAGLTPDDGDWAQVLAALRILFPGRGQMQAFGSSGTFTVPAGVHRIHCRVWGAGGGGGGVGSGGGGAAGGAGGGYAEGWYAVTPGAALAVTVGAGGGAGNGTPTAGGNGGSSSVGALLSATGGAGGQGAAGGSVASVTGSFGSGSGGQINVPGNPANAGIVVGGTTLGSAGGGAFCTSMVGAFSLSSGNSPGFPGGGGGGGGGNVPANGAAGANGFVIIEW